MSKIDLLVVNHNTRDKLKRLLDTLHADNTGNWRMFVTDNGSTDGSKQWLYDNWEWYPGIEKIYYRDNIGYSAAINMMSLDVRSEYMATLNADVWMSSEDVESILRTFAAYPDADIIGPKQRDEKGNITAAGIFGTNSKPVMRLWQRRDPQDRLARDVREAIMVSGSAVFIRSEVWEALIMCSTYQDFNRKTFGNQVEGAFLSTPHYYEETGFMYHARDHGYKILYDGTTSIGHSWHASSTVGGPADRKFAVSRKIFRDFCDYHGIERD